MIRDLLQDGVGKLLQLGVVLLTFLLLALKLFLGHLLQLILPRCLVVVQLIGGWWSESSEDQGVSVVAEGGQVSDVQLELASVLVKF